LRVADRHAAAPLHHGRGGARHALGDFSGAIADYNRALELDPGLTAAYISRGHARYHRRDPLGIQDYRMAFRLDPRLAASEVVRVLLLDLGRDPEAVLINSRKHIRINPGDLVAYTRRGLTRLLRGEVSEAEEDFREVLRRGPEWSDVLGLLIDEANRRRPS
jgi:tetratricopeptide (TPR) repeat protein